MIAIFLKEINSYFKTMIGYVFMGFFLLISGLFFNNFNIEQGSASISGTFAILSIVLVLLTPVLTMRLFAEERKTKTDQILLTSPVRITNIVVGKFLAAFFVLFVSSLLTLVYAIIISIFSEPFLWEFVLGYMGIFLVGSVFISVGIFMSCMTQNQLSAAFSTYAVLLILIAPTLIIPTVNDAFLKTVLNVLSIYSNVEAFQTGIFSIASVIYLLSFSFVFLFLTVKMIDRRRFLKG